MDLQAQWIVGFIDGQGHFCILTKQKDASINEFEILLEFKVVEHERNVQVLHALKSYFKCGVVSKNPDNKMTYRVQNIEHLTKMIIPFFEKHSLKTKRGIEFRKFRKILLKVKKNEPISLKEIESFSNLKCSL
uniref:Putative endonuclease n=1 Tax=Candidatus Fritschea bemisiae TaxID=206681 RepID=Q53EJ8_9BACT|nr:putative endonuclease [Candidatus Fritschea bemisiae]